MTILGKLKFLTVAVAAALVGSAAVAPVYAAENKSDFGDAKAQGLIIQYQPGVNPIASDGNPVAENAAHVELIQGVGLGGQLVTVRFAKDLALAEAIEIADRVATDPRVKSVSVDEVFQAASVSTKQITYSAVKAATAVRSLSIKDAWSNLEPSNTAVKLSWKAPLSLNSGKLVNYRIEYSSNGFKTWGAAQANKTTSFTVKGLAAGTKYSFRVRAVTAFSTTQKLGAASSVITFTATSAPDTPEITGAKTTDGKTSVTWAKQSLEQRGGLPVVYTISATDKDGVAISCSSAANTCVLPGAVVGSSYNATVTAKNSRGSAVSPTSTFVAGNLTDLKAFTPLDPYYLKQWYLYAAFGINAPKAWAISRGNTSVVVAVIDSGITDHPDLNAQVLPGYDFVTDPSKSNDGDGRDSDPTDPGDYGNGEASSWHGTHVAGIIAAQSNEIGVTGVAPNVKILPVRAMGVNGGSSSDLIAAINWAAGLSVPGVPANPYPAKVINMSMGTKIASRCDDYPSLGRLGSTAQALAAVKAAGVTTITAAGNFNTDARYSYPGNCYPTINVGATGFSGDKASYSNYTDPLAQGVGVDISAPGGDAEDAAGTPEGTYGQMLSTFNSGTTSPSSAIYAVAEGTSMAAPVVSGVVALMYSMKPSITFDQVWDILKVTVTPFKAGGICDTQKICGVGILNAGAALAAVAALP